MSRKMVAIMLASIFLVPAGLNFNLNENLSTAHAAIYMIKMKKITSRKCRVVLSRIWIIE